MKRPSTLRKVTLSCGILAVATAIGIPATAQQTGLFTNPDAIASSTPADSRPQADIFTPSYAASPAGVWAVGAGTVYASGSVSFTSDDGSTLPPGTMFIPGSTLPGWVALNSATGELTVTPPSGTAPGYYPVTMQVTYPDASVETITINLLVSEHVTGSENAGTAAYYTPIPIPPEELSRPGELGTVDLVFYSADFAEIVPAQDLVARGILTSPTLPEGARPWVSISGTQILFDLPADIPAGVTGIWQTVQVNYADGTSEYVNVVLPIDTSAQSLPAPVSTDAPTSAPTVKPSPEPTGQPTVEPTAPAPSADPTALPSVEPTIEPTADRSTAPTVEPSTASPSAAPVVPAPSATASEAPAVEPTEGASADSADSVTPQAQPVLPIASASASEVATDTDDSNTGKRSWLAHTGSALMPYLWVAGMALLAGGVILLSRDRRRY